MYKKIIHKKNNGYTLVEILVVIAIMGIVLATTTIALKSYNSKRNLELASQEVKTLLVEALTKSNSPEGNAKAYGVKFNRANKTAILFEDTNGDGLQNSAIKTIDLDDKWKGVSFDSSSISSAETAYNNPNEFSVVFGAAGGLCAPAGPVTCDVYLPYQKHTLVEASADFYKEKLVNIELKQGSEIRTIKVNSITNTIEVED